MIRQLTAIIEREGEGFVSLCPELDIASQGDSVEEAKANLSEAVTLFFETANPLEVRRRGSHAVMQKRTGESTLTVPVPLHRELRIGTLQSIIRQGGLDRRLFETG